MCTLVGISSSSSHTILLFPPRLDVCTSRVYLYCTCMYVPDLSPPRHPKATSLFFLVVLSAISVRMQILISSSQPTFSSGNNLTFPSEPIRPFPKRWCSSTRDLHGLENRSTERASNFTINQQILVSAVDNVGSNQFRSRAPQRSTALLIVRSWFAGLCLILAPSFQLVSFIYASFVDRPISNRRFDWAMSSFFRLCHRLI